LWISTLDGLARFDGVRFKIFKAGNTPALGILLLVYLVRVEPRAGRVLGHSQ
jgi:hypothetical protein